MNILKYLLLIVLWFLAVPLLAQPGDVGESSTDWEIQPWCDNGEPFFKFILYQIGDAAPMVLNYKYDGTVHIPSGNEEDGNCVNSLATIIEAQLMCDDPSTYIQLSQISYDGNTGTTTYSIIAEIDEGGVAYIPSGNQVFGPCNVSDTTLINFLDTTTIYVQDTSLFNLLDTLDFSFADTTLINFLDTTTIYVQDTSLFNLLDTLDFSFVDTTLINFLDTTTIYVQDTSLFNLLDTLDFSFADTTLINFLDTTTIYVQDTSLFNLLDTLDFSFADTTLINFLDTTTIYVQDTSLFNLLDTLDFSFVDTTLINFLDTTTIYVQDTSLFNLLDTLDFSFADTTLINFLDTTTLMVKDTMNLDYETYYVCANDVTLLVKEYHTGAVTDSLVFFQNNISVPAPINFTYGECGETFADTLRMEIIEECQNYINGTDTIQVYVGLVYSTITAAFVDTVYVDVETLQEVSVPTDCTPTVTVTPSTVAKTYTIDLVNPDDSNMQTIKYDLQPNDEVLNKVGRFIVTDELGNEVFNQLEIRPTSYFMAVRATSMVTGGFIESVKVRDTGGNIFTIPLASGTATLTGPGGTVAAADLIYNSGSTATLQAALESVIINYLAANGFTNFTNYNIQILVTNTGLVRISFSPKHLPTGLWLGLQYNDLELIYDRDGATQVTELAGSNHASGAPFTQTFVSPCGAINLITTAILPGEIDGSQTNFDQFVTVAEPYTYSINTGASNLSASCNVNFLTANVTGCTANTTYLWSNGETTQTIVDDGSSPTVTVDCDCYVIEPCCDICEVTTNQVANEEEVCPQKIYKEVITGTVKLYPANYFYSIAYTNISGTVIITTEDPDGGISNFSLPLFWSEGDTTPEKCEYLGHYIKIDATNGSARVALLKDN